MGILAQCPFCRRRQSAKNKKCKCGENELKNAMAQYTGWLDGQAEAVFQNLDHFLDHATKKGLTVLVSRG